MGQCCARRLRKRPLCLACGAAGVWHRGAACPALQCSMSMGVSSSSPHTASILSLARARALLSAMASLHSTSRLCSTRMRERVGLGMKERRAVLGLGEWAGAGVAPGSAAKGLRPLVPTIQARFTMGGRDRAVLGGLLLLLLLVCAAPAPPALLSKKAGKGMRGV